MLPSLYRKDHTGPTCSYFWLRLNKHVYTISKFTANQNSTLGVGRGEATRRHTTAKWNQSWQLDPKERDQNKPNRGIQANKQTTEKQTAGLRSTRVWGRCIWERPALPSNSRLAYRAVCKRCSSEFWRQQRDSVSGSDKRAAGWSWTPGEGQSTQLCPSADATVHQSSPASFSFT